MTDQPRHHGPGHQPRDHGIAHHPRYHGTDEGAGADAAGEQRTARQRWKLAALIAVVAALVLTILIMHLTGAMGKGTGF